MKILRVDGDSMSPVLRHGDILVAKRTKPRALRAGFLYVVAHSELGQIVKRLLRIENDRAILVGDNPKSTPASIIGPVELSRIHYRVVLSLSKSGIRLH